jgi:glutamyl-tRNA synthetase
MTSPIVRFAPSPTGKLHIGNVRTGLINFLFTRKHGGKFILRIDDTDLERSTKENEAAIKSDLRWLGLDWDETFNQSERFADYDAAAATLKAKGLLYACYETEEELERRRKIAESRGRPPVYDRAALKLTDAERAALEAEGRKPHWRFLLSGNRVEWNDLVRGRQSIDTSSLSDPILIREDGSYLYTLPSVVDDIRCKITHVVRGEDHVTNSGAQIEIFEALSGKAPEMAHLALFMNKDGVKESKRKGAVSMEDYRADGILPMAISSLLAKLGTSDNVEPRLTLAELSADFDFAKMGRAAARFDPDDLKPLNAAILARTPFADVKEALMALDPRAGNEAFWLAVRANVAKLDEVRVWADMVYGAPQPLVDEADRTFLAEACALLPAGEMTQNTWSEWTKAASAATGRKGKALFMTLRRALTGRENGPEMGPLLPLIGRAAILARLGG